MTFKLNPAVAKICYTVTLIFPNGKRKDYENGQAAADAEFDQKYVVESLKAVGDVIEIMLKNPVVSGLNWIGEEAVSFF